MLTQDRLKPGKKYVNQ